MTKRKLVCSLIIAVCSLSLGSGSASAQKMNTVFSEMFGTLLGPSRLQKAGGLAGHQNHFLHSDTLANDQIVPALNSLIAGNVSSFPLSSTGGGVIYEASTGLDPVTGLPLPATASLGPIFGETARPLGAGKIALEISTTYLDLASFRGLPTDQMTFTFTHQEVPNRATGKPDSVLGLNPNESDIMAVRTDLHARASIGAVSATVGLTRNLDIGVAVPLISLTLSGTARATISSYSFAVLGFANHYFGGDSLHPVLSTAYDYHRTATGIGDVAIRAKYSIARGEGIDAAALLDVRLPTGNTDNFLGTGKTSASIWGILSKRYGDFTPHLNVGYTSNPAALQSDLVQFRAGFDSRISSSLAFAFDLLGRIDLNKSEAIHLFPGSTTIYDHPGKFPSTDSSGVAARDVPNSNIPDAETDNIFNAAAGFRYSPADNVIILLNVLIPLNNRGLRAALAPTLGVSTSF
jgi:hypothetical protein